MHFRTPRLRAAWYLAALMLSVSSSSFCQPSAVALSTDNKSQYNPSIKFNPGNTSKIIVSAADRNTSFYQRPGVFESTDGGGSWTRSVLEDGSYAIRGKWSRPAFNSDGTETYIIMTDYDWDTEAQWAKSNAIQLLSRRPSPGYWETTTIVSHVIAQGVAAEFEKEPYVTHSSEQPNGLFSCWTKSRQNGSNDIYFARSTDLGATFLTPIRVTDGSASVGTPATCVIHVGNNVYKNYVFWLQSSPTSIRFDQKDITATTFGSDAVLASFSLAGRGNSAPNIATYSNNIYIAWAGSYLGSTEIIYAKLGTSTASFITTDLPGDQWSPSIAVDPNGRISISYYSQNDANSPVEVFLSASKDGKTFVHTKLSQAAQTYSGLQADYLGLDATASSYYSVWTDTRNGNLDLYGATFAPREVTLENRAISDYSFGTIGRWVGGGFNQDIPSGTRAVFHDGSFEVLRASQSSVVVGGVPQKYLNWNDIQSDIINHQGITVNSLNPVHFARFEQTLVGTFTFKNELVDNVALSST